MIVAGIHLPDTDTHFGPLLESSEQVDGKGTYQFSKLCRAIVLVKNKGHAVDVGAQVGLWTRVLALEFESVTAFEPVLEFAECLGLNCSEFDNVNFYPFALGSHHGTIGMAAEKDIATAHVVPDGRRNQVPISPLDAYKLKPIDFLKIDAEGYETAIVVGAEKTIRRDKPIIVIEQKRKRLARYGLKPEAGVDLLKSWGAEVAWEDHGDWCLIFPQ